MSSGPISPGSLPDLLAGRGVQIAPRTSRRRRRSPTARRAACRPGRRLSQHRQARRVEVHHLRAAAPRPRRRARGAAAGPFPTSPDRPASRSAARAPSARSARFCRCSGSPSSYLSTSSVGDQRRAELAAADHLVAQRRAHQLAVARRRRRASRASRAARRPRRASSSIDLGHVVSDALPLRAARRAGPLARGHRDRVLDAPQVRRRGRRTRRLLRRLAAAPADLVIPRRCASFLFASASASPARVAARPRASRNSSSCAADDALVLCVRSDASSRAAARARCCARRAA